MKSLREFSIKWLKWGEKYTRTDMVYLAKGGFWLGLGQFVSSGSAFLTSIAFANLLSPETFGTYKYILSINSLLLITALGGMDSAVTQSVARGFDGTLEKGVRTKIKWGALGTVISFGIAVYYFLQGNMLLSIAFSITAFFVPFTESFDMFNSLLWGKKLFDVQTKYNVTKKVISLAAIIGTVFITQNIYIILIAYFFSITIPNLYFLYRTKRLYVSNNNVDPESMSYGKKLSGIYIITLLLTELDKVLVFHYVGAANLAIYSLAVAPTDQIRGLLKNVYSLAMPKFAQRTIEEIKENIWSKVRILGFFTVAIVAVYFALAPLFFSIFFPKYITSVHYSQILSLSLIPAVLAGFLYTVLESQKATKELFQYNLYGNIMGLIIMFPLIYMWGLWGAILARTINRLIMLGLGVKLVSKKY